MKYHFKKISIIAILWLIKLIQIIGKGFIFLILKPIFEFIKIISYFIFRNAFLKLYKLYLRLTRKFRIPFDKKKSSKLIFSQKLLHLTLSTLTIILIFTNLTKKTHAESIIPQNNKTILSTLIENEFSSLEEEELIEEFFDQEAIISPAQQSYLQNLSAVKSQPVTDVEYLNRDYEDMDTLSGVSVLRNANNITRTDEDIQAEEDKYRKETIYYTVQPGDSISTIAYRFGVSVNTVLWENDLNAYSIIRPGNRLAILQTSGISYRVKSGDNLSKIAKRYDVTAKDIIDSNNIKDRNKLRSGQKLIIPGGRKIKYTASSKKSYSAIDAIRDIVKAGSNPVTSNKMYWPTEGHRITQYYSWRHRGLDIANKTGTPLYASDAGIVEYAGWGKGYGNQIIINHGGGKKTRYAHASKLYVKKGQRVDKSEAIAAMGSTGWSTGPHIHFEIIINGKKQNPLNYIK